MAENYGIFVDVEEVVGDEIIPAGGKDDVVGVITHRGVFHADEVTAIALLRVFYPKARTVLFKRVDRQEDIEEYKDDLIRVGAREVFIIDVGGELDPDNLKFDHHQLDPSTTEGQVSSAGLIYNWLGKNGYINPLIVGKMTKLINVIDASEVGLRPAEIYEIPNVISYMNSDEPYNDKKQHELFAEAVEFMTKFLNGIKIEGEELFNIIVKLKKVSKNIIDKHILDMGEYIPFWNIGIFDIPELDNVDIVIWEEKFTGEWKAQVVPDSPGSLGIRGRKLKYVEPFPDGIIFIHEEELFAVAEDKESLLDYIRNHAE